MHYNDTITIDKEWQPSTVETMQRNTYGKSITIKFRINAEIWVRYYEGPLFRTSLLSVHPYTTLSSIHTLTLSLNLTLILVGIADLRNSRLVPTSGRLSEHRPQNPGVRDLAFIEDPASIRTLASSPPAFIKVICSGVPCLC